MKAQSGASVLVALVQGVRGAPDTHSCVCESWWKTSEMPQRCRMKHSCRLQMKPQNITEIQGEDPYGMPLATETALAGNCPRDSRAIEDSLCHLGACEDGLCVPSVSDPASALQLSTWIKASPPGGPEKVLKSLVWCPSSRM